jgi:hypothetical protein
MKRHLVGKLLISLVAVETGLGSLIADFNESHVFNAAWNEHARFHGAVGVFVSAALMVLSLVCLWRRAGDQRFQLAMGAWLAAIFMGSFIPSGMLPGAGYEEPGHPRPMLFGVLAPQLIMAIISMGLVVAGYLLARPGSPPADPAPAA